VDVRGPLSPQRHWLRADVGAGVRPAIEVSKFMDKVGQTGRFRLFQWDSKAFARLLSVRTVSDGYVDKRPLSDRG
jgi:hypothetical protein